MYRHYRGPDMINVSLGKAVVTGQDDSYGQAASYSRFACIGCGFSAVALGATLKRWHGITDIRFFERQSSLGGVRLANKYPGP